MLKNLIICCVLLFSTSNLMAQNETTKKYKLVVQFGSFAEGVPGEEPLIAYIDRFKTEHNIKCFCVDRIGPLGREGEYNLAFMLTELNKKQTAAFIQGVKKVAATMTERGQATVVTDHVMNREEIPARATIVSTHL